MVPEFDLTAGAPAIKRVSGVGGVSNVVALSVISRLVCSVTWKGSRDRSLVVVLQIFPTR